MTFLSGGAHCHADDVGLAKTDRKMIKLPLNKFFCVPSFYHILFSSISDS